jgi:Na+/H+ antiporter NhaD/arsenite permease-like protein
VPQIPIDFVLFALTLAGVALFHHHTLRVALSGLTVIAVYKVLFSPFREGAGVAGLGVHLTHEWVVIANLGLLLTGFALLARHFEESGVPEALPRVLPDGWVGGFALLALVFVLSSFLDNIAAALIGATVAKIVFPTVHIGYLAAIVAASNAGGSGSVVGDTTTTMMWIDGVSPLDVTHAYLAAVPALIVSGVIAARSQHAFSPMRSDAALHHRIDWGRITVVAVLLLAALAANIGVNAVAPDLANAFPVLGFALWLAIAVTAAYRTPDWSVLRGAVVGSVFLLSLVLAASMMPVERLPVASWQTALGLGFVSAVFDNIPLTALALRQGGYDWGFLAYAVGYGGSMIWFGSSAGVAVTNVFPEAKSVGQWLKHGWHVALAYVVGFAALLLLAGWHPHAPHRDVGPAVPAAAAPAH